MKQIKGTGVRKKEILKKDEFNLQRFLTAQNDIYSNVIAELKQGKKESHWMWFIFPQLKGLGISENSDYYGILNEKEAIAYLLNPILRNRYLECCKILLTLNTTSKEIFGIIDERKLLSSLTLFSHISDNKIIAETKRKFFGNTNCEYTKKALSELNS